MTSIDIVGWIAGGLVLAAFYLKTMVALRCVAIASNVAFITYGVMAEALPILVLHTLLLPMNSLRLLELRRVARCMQGCDATGAPLAALMPHVHIRRLPRGTKVFARGEPAESMYLILSGRVHIEEENAIAEAGEIVGESDLFSADRRRNLTAVCASEVELAVIGGEKLRELIYSNPELAAYLSRRLAARLGRRAPAGGGTGGCEEAVAVAVPVSRSGLLHLTATL